MPESQGIVVLLSTDLMFGSTVSGFASAAGVEFQNPSDADGIASKGGQTSAYLLLIDLETPGLDISSLAESLDAETRSSAIAYGPHVHKQRLALAEQVGIGTVMSRGQFHSTVGALIAAWAEKS